MPQRHAKHGITCMHFVSIKLIIHIGICIYQERKVMTKIVQHMYHRCFALLIHLQSAEPNMTWNDGGYLSEDIWLLKKVTAPLKSHLLRNHHLSNEEIDSMMLTESHRSLSCQTDMTMLDLAKMEVENKQMKEELKLFYENNLGYPKKEQLQEDKKQRKTRNNLSFILDWNVLQCSCLHLNLLQKILSIPNITKFQLFTAIFWFCWNFGWIWNTVIWLFVSMSIVPGAVVTHNNPSIFNDYPRLKWRWRQGMTVIYFTNNQAAVCETFTPTYVPKSTLQKSTYSFEVPCSFLLLQGLQNW